MRAGRAGKAGASPVPPATIDAPPELAAAIAAAASRSTIPLSVRWHSSLPSTMDAARDAAEAGAPEGLVVIAGTQTAGRGRRGHSWSSPAAAGIYASFMFRPPETMRGRRLSLLTLAAGVGVRSSIIVATGLAPDLKWPNDLLCGRRKLAGLLAEGLSLGTGAAAVVIGVGVNVQRAFQPPDLERRATSIEEELGRPVDFARLLEELLVEVPAAYAVLRGGGADDILGAWRAAAPSACAAAVEWDGPSGLAQGVTAGIDDDGALLIRSGDRLERVISGEVRWLCC